MPDHTLPSFMTAPPPAEPLPQVRRLARDLAYGSLYDFWLNRFFVSDFPSLEWNVTGRESHHFRIFGEYVSEVWHQHDLVLPHPELLFSLGYFAIARQNEHGKTDIFQVTEKAYNLIENPSLTQSVFISYKRSCSSTVAMLMWAYLQRIGLDPFIDIEGIPPGDDWWQVIEKEITSANTFISLITHETFESEIVLNEIKLALKNKDTTRIVPVLHDGFRPNDLIGTELEALTDLNLRVVPENALADQILGVLESLRQGFGIPQRDRHF